MRILQVGQLPKEMGGNYTTGVARVVGELSKHKFGSHNVFLYGTNISEAKAKALCSYNNQYMGYVKRPIHIILHIILHPFATIRAYKTYKETEKTSFFHMEFLRDNFSRVIDIVRPDIIHYHGTALSAMYAANSNRRIPIIYSPHGIMWVNNERGGADYNWLLKATKMSLSFADYYTALNESVVKRLSLLGIDKQRISIVPNGVDSNKFYYSVAARKKMRDAMNVSNTTIVFITVGLVIDRKGQFDFLKILQYLNIDYQYWIVGQGPDYEPISKYAKENNIQNRVRLLGYIEDKELYKYHSAADIYVHGSTEEAQALSEIEANACGLCTIVNEKIAETVIGDSLKDINHYFVLDFSNYTKELLISWISGRNQSARISSKEYDWAQISAFYADCYDKVSKTINV